MGAEQQLAESKATDTPQGYGSWFVERFGECEGPYDHGQIDQLLMDGELKTTSLVWRKGMSGWTSISQVDEFREAVQEVPPPLPKKPLERISADVANSLSAKPRPWVRLLARNVDYVVFGLFLAVLAGLLDFGLLVKNPFVLAILTVLLWIPVEAALLSTWGYTPGKALLRVRVRKGLGSLPSFKDALRRSFRVWWIGEGMCLPLFFPFTAGSAYRNFKVTASTRWDRAGHFTVWHEHIGRLRLAMLLIFYVNAIALLIWSRLA